MGGVIVTGATPGRTKRHNQNGVCGPTKTGSTQPRTKPASRLGRHLAMRARALSIRSRARSRPSTSRDSNRGRPTLRPSVATRIGAWTFPNLRPSFSPSSVICGPERLGLEVAAPEPLSSFDQDRSCLGVPGDRLFKRRVLDGEFGREQELNEACRLGQCCSALLDERSETREHRRREVGNDSATWRPRPPTSRSGRRTPR